MWSYRPIKVQNVIKCSKNTGMTCNFTTQRGEMPRSGEFYYCNFKGKWVTRKVWRGKDGHATTDWLICDIFSSILTDHCLHVNSAYIGPVFRISLVEEDSNQKIKYFFIW